MSLSLDEQVKAFQEEPLPAQINVLKTAWLVSDLWKEVQRLRKDPMEDGTGYYDLVKEISRLNAHIANQDHQLDLGYAELDQRWTKHVLEREGLKHELDQTRTDAAYVVRALDAAVQLVEMLIAFTPEGSPLHPDVAGAKNALDQALTVIGVRKP